ncbi:AAA family ATPase [Scytonema sp. UIC 10036]|uniref:AAA family ATPase n=1 Tax=Scytonema sp. UIC 10036 TaxID=2304196 RepID=UPI00140FCCA9|nr:AAA family ATPase [Scytonema sp. UIC 10036]
MKLHRLYLESYQVLRNLEIYFSPKTENVLTQSPSYSLDFLVGVHGTGKSTVLRVLFDLMRKLERNAPIEYAFELKYELGETDTKRQIKLSNFPEETELENFDTQDVLPLGELKVWENDVEVQLSRSVLPEIVVAFTTGSETAWKKLDDIQSLDSGYSEAIQELSLLDRAIREIPGKPPNLDTLESYTSQEESQFLFIEADRLSLVTLCGLLADIAQTLENQRLEEVLQGTSISQVTGFSLKFRMTQGSTSLADREEVKRLAKLATRTLRLGSDYLLVFDLTASGNSIAQAIIEEFSSGLHLFKILARLGRVGDGGQPVLRAVNIFLERSRSNHPENEQQDDPPLLLFDWLSDGEQSFLARMCLFTLLGETEALILLDEPEVHFNDFWKRKIVSLLDKTLEGRQSHVLITTHSSITLTDVLEEDIVILNRFASYTENARNPDLKTFAADPSDIMVHVFNAPHPAGQRSVSYIQRILSEPINENLEERRQTLENLLAVVAQGYWSYKIRRQLLEIEPE